MDTNSFVIDFISPTNHSNSSPSTPEFPKNIHIKNIILEKEKSVRKITNTKKWKLEKDDYNFEKQIQILKNINNTCETPSTPSSTPEFSVSATSATPLRLQTLESTKESKELQETLFKSEIKNKINSYRSQDIIKKLYQENIFVDLEHVIKILFESKLDCFYCKKKVNIIYENVREPSQWTLERIDNSFGHNKDNVVIACLSCNLKRRTMYHERFVFTKQMCNVTKI